MVGREYRAGREGGRDCVANATESRWSGGRYLHLRLWCYLPSSAVCFVVAIAQSRAYAQATFRSIKSNSPAYLDTYLVATVYIYPTTTRFSFICDVVTEQEKRDSAGEITKRNNRGHEQRTRLGFTVEMFCVRASSSHKLIYRRDNFLLAASSRTSPDRTSYVTRYIAYPEVICLASPVGKYIGLELSQKPDVPTPYAL